MILLILMGEWRNESVGVYLLERYGIKFIYSFDLLLYQKFYSLIFISCTSKARLLLLATTHLLRNTINCPHPAHPRHFAKIPTPRDSSVSKSANFHLKHRWCKWPEWWTMWILRKKRMRNTQLIGLFLWESILHRKITMLFHAFKKNRNKV